MQLSNHVQCCSFYLLVNQYQSEKTIVLGKSQIFNQAYLNKTWSRDSAIHSNTNWNTNKGRKQTYRNKQ
jgi:hypothetical protein